MTESGYKALYRTIQRSIDKEEIFTNPKELTVRSYVCSHEVNHHKHMVSPIRRKYNTATIPADTKLVVCSTNSIEGFHLTVCMLKGGDTNPTRRKYEVEYADIEFVSQIDKGTN